MDIEKNLELLSNGISAACAACGRNPSEVTLVAVSKTKPASMIISAHGAGQTDFGENYVQELERKYAILKEADINWHVIGPVQTNKVKYITRICHLLHSLDRETLADALQKRLAAENGTINALIQVNTSGEESKSGVTPQKLPALAEYISRLPNIKVKGLMTISENEADENIVRGNFRQLRELFNELKQRPYENFDMQHLSMGMSGDYKIAIEEGATILRIGSAIFGSRK